MGQTRREFFSICLKLLSFTYVSDAKKLGALYLHGTFFLKFPRVQVLLQMQSCVIPGSLIFCEGNHVPKPNEIVLEHLWPE